MPGEEEEGMEEEGMEMMMMTTSHMMTRGAPMMRRCLVYACLQTKCHSGALSQEPMEEEEEEEEEGENLLESLFDDSFESSENDSSSSDEVCMEMLAKEIHYFWANRYAWRCLLRILKWNRYCIIL